jgi:microcystin-dependent protein
MGGAGSPGLLTSISSGIRTVVNALFGVDTNTLSISNLPAHTHANTLNDPGHTHTTTADRIDGSTSDVTPGSVRGSGTAATVGSNTTGITITNASVGSGVAVNNVRCSLVFLRYPLERPHWLSNIFVIWRSMVYR